MPRATIIKIILGSAALTAILVIVTWLAGGFEGVSGAGIGALIIGVAASILLGIGLMSLIYASARGGYDEAAHDAAKSQFKERPAKDQ